MLIGTNWSGNREISQLKSLISQNKIEFIEIMIDNFLECTPDSIIEISNELPLAFHIMNSQFMHRSINELQVIGRKIRYLKTLLNPIYISDHVGIFYHDSLPLPTMCEVNYTHDRQSFFDAVKVWQDIIGDELYLENYPSVLKKNGVCQPQFFKDMIEQCGNGLLFDISNAVIAQNNTETPFSQWLDIDIKHLHIGGYEHTTLPSHFLVDTHAVKVSELSIAYLKHVIQTTQGSASTLSVERDENFLLGEWINDIDICRQSGMLRLCD